MQIVLYIVFSAGCAAHVLQSLQHGAALWWWWDGKVLCRAVLCSDMCCSSVGKSWLQHPLCCMLVHMHC